MPPSLSPLLGYNTNVRHKGKVFHVQTEDSGPRYAHVITHLFVDGGRILKTLKSSYAKSIGAEDQCDVVRALMKRQHKAMLMAVRDGLFDQLAEIHDPASAAPAPAPKTSGASATLQSIPAEMRPPPKGQPTAPRIVPVSPKRQPERASSRKAAPSPPPDRVTARKGARTDALPSDGVHVSRAAPDRLPRPSLAAAPNAGPHPHARAGALGGATPSSERRLVPSRPASAFGHAKLQQGKSIFGEDASTDRSLDEVILSYLALDGDPERKKG